MTPHRTTAATLTALWVFVMFNYLYCDVVSLMDPVLLPQYLSGKVAGMTVTPGFLLGASVLMEIPIGMTALTWATRPAVSRRLNLAAGLIMTLVQAATLFTGTPTAYYAFFSAIEISATLLIAWCAWRWRTAEVAA